MTPKELHAATMATLGSIIFVTFSTIYSEVSAPFKTFLASTFGHHWIAKSVLSVVVFVLVYYYFTRMSKGKNHWNAWQMAKNVTIVSILAGLIIFGFYVNEFWGG
ncbi:MAG: hypothetical protein FJY86_04465 [Candidatus Diapherotrites archaeon]|uniref:Uncharacterized protein n=1 Tax=Candidatus Iainarchaeum sp. TaxID=3101447 RepID=A0A8T4C999_9ARCH|nr:hypothetical protein [Candidatus Diapherotrites archaeon]